jgi:Co/Zn/Cd efflux system component
MDCPSEENMIRMKLDGLSGIRKLEFDLEKRTLTVYHHEQDDEIKRRLDELDLGAELSTKALIDIHSVVQDDARTQRKLLWSVLFINFGFFLIELTAGLISNSMGLVADSLDMLADSLVYGMSLWAVGSALSKKKKIARISGYFQLALDLLGITEIVRRFIIIEAVPDYGLMIGVSFAALIANAFCLYLLQKSRSEEAHMKASLIFTSNDVMINAGVIFAGILVLLTHSRYPDLIIGSIVFLIVVRGALRIIKLGK